ncbi:uncharacterized protein B0J16DRAFT_157086 [Fusarium flagelliforme]|uniref:uncharacterized protein n=1 Tax=Fusarium flagelliforme TaxID=2675880 RepID=UPI001E8ED48B|nr:uncharacterized protein B0J16DRAFT_157086 [Fusarium flagelliforme]KAH7182917.1 hypothetical protein B0J16DRAFT_157086 [Fusarium flagelliforme]
MLRLKPTAIVITTPEMADAERRSRYRKHLIKRQGGDRRHAKTSAPRNEGVAFEDAINTMIQTDTDSDSGQGSRSLSSPEMSAREERVPVISSPDGSIDGEAHTMPLRSRTQFDNMINYVIEQHEDERDADRRQLATALDIPIRIPGQEPEPTNFSRDLDVIASMIAEELNVTPPRRSLPVYSDGLPVNQQPQTPRQLPEARHQSRFNGAHTAPVRGRRTEADIEYAPVTVRRRRAGRNTSLVGLGLRTSDFQDF